MFGFVGGLKAAAWQVLWFLVAVGLIIGFFTWAFNNKNTFTAVAGSVGNAAASVVISSANWVADQAGGSAATTGPKVIYIKNDAPLSWHVGGAIRVWNKGLKNVQLKAVKECPSTGTCFKVSQEADLPDTDGRVTVGHTSTWFGDSIEFNGAAQVSDRTRAVSACHELGHALGLEHRTTVKSCMHATVNASVSTRPDKADYAAVDKKYGD